MVVKGGTVGEVASHPPLRYPHGVQGYLAHENLPPLYDHHRSLGTGLLQSPTGRGVLMSEVPL